MFKHVSQSLRKVRETSGKYLGAKYPRERLWETDGGEGAGVGGGVRRLGTLDWYSRRRTVFFTQSDFVVLVEGSRWVPCQTHFR